MGENAVSACDTNLRNVGTYQLQPEAEQEVAKVDDTTDFYWKNTHEHYWTHRTVWRFDNVVYLDMSHHEDSNEPVDICDRSHRTARLRAMACVSGAPLVAEAQPFPKMDGQSQFVASLAPRDDDPRDSIDLGNGIVFYIVGRDRDGYQIKRDGRLLSFGEFRVSSG